MKTYGKKLNSPRLREPVRAIAVQDAMPKHPAAAAAAAATMYKPQSAIRRFQVSAKIVCENKEKNESLRHKIELTPFKHQSWQLQSKMPCKKHQAAAAATAT